MKVKKMRKNLKVYYLRRRTAGGFEELPHIRLAGRWLAAAGFVVGDNIRITVDGGRLIIEKAAPVVKVGPLKAVLAMLPEFPAAM